MKYERSLAFGLILCGVALCIGFVVKLLNMIGVRVPMFEPLDED